MEDISQKISNTLLERPIGFKIGKRRLYLYPPTLGKMQLVGQLAKALKFNDKLLRFNSNLELMRIVKEQSSECCRLIAYHCLRGKNCLDNTKVEEVMNFLGCKASMEDLALILQLIFTPSHLEEIKKFYGIDKELEEYNKVNSKKDNGSTLIFGGKSIYGAIISPLAEKYGWTMDYIMWGISYDNIQLLLSDSVKTVYLTDEESKRIHTTRNKEVIRVDDPKNLDRILAMQWD